MEVAKYDWFQNGYVSAALLASTRMGDLVLLVFISIDEAIDEVKLFEVFTILLLNRKKNVLMKDTSIYLTRIELF